MYECAQRKDARERSRRINQRSGGSVLCRQYRPHPCVYRKLKTGRSGDGVRLGWVQAGQALDPSFAVRRFRDAINARNDLTFLAGGDRTIEGMRLAGVPEG